MECISLKCPKRRKQPTALHKRTQLLKQGHRCFYCGTKFGEWFMRKTKLCRITPVWDHVLPFIYSFNNNSENFVAACQLCNSIKGPKVFDSITEAKEYVIKRRAEKGLSVQNVRSAFYSDPEVAKVLFSDVSHSKLLAKTDLGKMSNDQLAAYIEQAKLARKCLEKHGPSLFKK